MKSEIEAVKREEWRDGDLVPRESFSRVAVRIVFLTMVLHSVSIHAAWAQGLVLETNEILHQDLFPGTSAFAGDEFGTTQVSGDFDGDGFYDLAVGVPYENVLGEADAGQVNILYGSRDGLDPGSIWISNWIDGGLPEPNDRYGAAMASGDFDADGFDDLAIGVPGRVVNLVDDAGAVSILYGGPEGLTAVGRLLVHQDVGDLTTSAEDGDAFGSSLTSGDFDGNGFDDLAIGVPLENVSSVVNGGAVHVLPGSSSGIQLTGTQYWTQDSTGIAGTAEEQDKFGASLAAGNFDAHCYGVGPGECDDLAIGVTGDLSGAGAFHIIYGGINLLVDFDNEYIAGANYGHPSGPGDLYAISLAAGKLLGSDVYDDLVVSAPNHSTRVTIFPGSQAGLHPFGSFYFHSGAPGDLRGWSLGVGRFERTVSDADATLVLGAPGYDLPGLPNAGLVDASASGWPINQDTYHMLDQAEEDDFFGWSLGIGDFNGDGADDLSVGIPLEEVDGLPGDSGAIQVIYTDDRVFGDGFESGDTAAWSFSAP